MSDNTSGSSSRRDFLKTGTVAAIGGSLVGQMAFNSSVHAAGTDKLLRVGLVGCGGRGTGAANQALSADPKTELVAMADVFADQLDKSYNILKKQPVGDRVTVDDDHKFVGFDAFQRLIDSGVDVVLLTTSPHFRPQHLKAVVEAGKHCFVEKPVAVDAPGVRSILQTCKLAEEKGLAIVSGLCYRYEPSKMATFEQVHGGLIGETISVQCTYNTSELWHRTPPADVQWSEMETQMRNWLYYTWLSGDHITEQHIHSLDKMAWAMRDAAPVKVTATGGRQVRTDAKWGNIYDHFSTVYEYENGVKGFANCRQQNGCSRDVSDHVFGTKGRAEIMKHRIYDRQGKTIWRFRDKNTNMYQAEHDAFFASIRSGNPINNGKYMSQSTMMAISARMSAYTGKTITWEQAMNSKLDLTPPHYEWKDLPVTPVATPGVTEFV